MSFSSAKHQFTGAKLIGKEKILAEKADNILADDCKNELPVFKTSVRSLVSFSIKDDALWSFSSYRLAYEGTKAHSLLQAKNREDENYSSEVYLTHSFETADCILEVSGRADGIWRYNDRVIIQEIKTSAIPLSEIGENFSDAHWAQAKCYAYILALSEDLDKVTVRLTYYESSRDEEKSFDRVFTREKLRRFFRTLLHPYINWCLSQKKWKDTRNLSIKALEFPYPTYRKGQKLLAYNVYKCIEDRKRLFVQSPTGTGKTMGVLYPSIKALGEGKLDRLFYATAKTTTRSIAENAYKILAEQGLRLKVLTLTAKEKMCLNDIKNCSPDKCPFILGYVSRSRKIIKNLLKKHDLFSRDIISSAGLRNGICPFELSLDLALSCDLIICDYNYIFDPRVYLRRFFEQKGREEYLIMADEAHNLFDRAREMYSSELNVKTLMEISKMIKKDLPHINSRIRKLKKAITAFEKQSGELAREAGGVLFETLTDAPMCLKPAIESLITETEDWIISEREEKPYSDKLITFLFDLLHFKNVLELYNDQYRTLITGSKAKFSIRLLCLDPSPMLNRNMSAARASILFSATLSPLWYFKNILGGRDEDITLKLPSPFPRENLLVFNEDTIETRFRHRSQYIEATAKAIYEWAISHKGNVMVFFPSYKYMLDVIEKFRELGDGFDILCQDREMDEPAREAFLRKFDNYGDTNRIAFCVMGGIFGEGIDLTGDRLTGVIIVGVGLPQISPELETMRDYYHEKCGAGFTYAYTYPGLNKVLQASGRLIRSVTDRGTLLLIDSRFATPEYTGLLPQEWLPMPRTSQGLGLKEYAERFWMQKDSS